VKISKKEGRVSIWFLRRIWKKIIRPQKTYFFGQTKKEKKEKNKNQKKQINLLQSYTPCLNSQSVKKRTIEKAVSCLRRNIKMPPWLWLAQHSTMISLKISNVVNNMHRIDYDIKAWEFKYKRIKQIIHEKLIDRAAASCQAQKRTPGLLNKLTS